MLRSMTGYARASAETEAYEVVAELRTVNHRYLDVRLRGSAGVQALDKQVRDRVSRELGRGKVDVSLNLVPRGESAYEVEVDVPLMRQLVVEAKKLGETTGVGATLSLSDLVGFSAGFRVKERDLSQGSAIWEAVEPALEEALAALTEMREAEGAEMAADMEARIEALTEHVEAVARLSESSRASRKEQLAEKVQEIVGSALEPAAIAMEVSRLVERSDIAEELTRFRSHVELWGSTVEGEGPQGKKLDFIVQEMNREVNTMGSKCQDSKIAEIVIAMKAELERIREQVQNIE